MPNPIFFAPAASQHFDFHGLHVLVARLLTSNSGDLRLVNSRALFPRPPDHPALVIELHSLDCVLGTMGKINLTALRVRKTALNQFASGKINKLPQWVDVVGEIPPSETLIRTPPPQHQLVRQRMKTVAGSSKPQVVFEVQEKRRKSKKPSRLFQPLELKYEEDELRQDFFRDHPWELARPRVLLESTGKDHENYDWSRIKQPGKRLDGERYVFTLQIRISGDPI